jgi:alpha-mannosidase
VLRPGHASLVVVPHGGDWAEGRLGRIAESVLHPVHVAHGTGPRHTPLASVEGLSLTGGEVDLLSLRMRPDGDGRLEVRLVNSSDVPTTAVLGAPSRPISAATRCDALGRRGEDLAVQEGVVRMPLRPWEIATVAFE